MTDFLDAQRRAGGVFTRDNSDGPSTREFAPHAWHFCCPNAEYIAAKDSAAVFDVSDRSQIRMTGSARAKFLHSFCSNDIKSLDPGQGCEAFITSVKGRVIGHVFAFVDQDEIWLDSVAGSSVEILQHLNKYAFVEDVDLVDESASQGELLICGAEATDAFNRIGIAVGGLELCEHKRFAWQEAHVHVRRVSMLCVPSFLVSAEHQLIANLWQALVDSKSTPAGADAFEAIRVESLYPIHGVDISEDNIAQEVSRTESAISFTKGCYLGQEPIARLDALGHVNKALRGIRLDSAVSLAEEAILTAVDDDKEVGRITSWAVIPGHDETVAMGMIRRRFMDAGTELLVRSGTECHTARVT